MSRSQPVIVLCCLLICKCALSQRLPRDYSLNITQRYRIDTMHVSGGYFDEYKILNDSSQTLYGFTFVKVGGSDSTGSYKEIESPSYQKILIRDSHCTILAEQLLTLKNDTAVKYLISYKYGDIPYLADIIVTIKNGSNYSISYAGTNDNFEKYQADFMKILQTIKIQKDSSLSTKK